MAATGAERAEEDSADSDDSNSGGRPAFSAQERELLHKLLKNTNEYIRFYEERQPEVQQIVNLLFEHTEKLLDQYSKAVEVNSQLRTNSVRAGLGFSLGIVAFVVGLLSMFLFSDDDDDILWSVAGAAFGAGIAAVVINSKVYKRNQQAKENMRETLERIQKTRMDFNATAENITSQLKRIRNVIENILQLKSRFPLVKGETGEFRKHEEALSELMKLCRPDELLSLVKRQTVLDWRKKTQQHVVPLPIITQGFSTLGDIDALKKQASVPEDDLEAEAEAEQLDGRLREMTKHLKRILRETRTLTLEVERLTHKLNEHFNR